MFQLTIPCALALGKSPDQLLIAVIILLRVVEWILFFKSYCKYTLHLFLGYPRHS